MARLPTCSCFSTCRVLPRSCSLVLVSVGPSLVGQLLERHPTNHGVGPVDVAVVAFGSAVAGEVRPFRPVPAWRWLAATPLVLPSRSGSPDGRVQ